MKVWHHLPVPGKCWHLVRSEEGKFDANGPMRAANTAITALWPVVRPLSVTLELVARSPNRRLDERYIPGVVLGSRLTSWLSMTDLLRSSGSVFPVEAKQAPARESGEETDLFISERMVLAYGQAGDVSASTDRRLQRGA